MDRLQKERRARNPLYTLLKQIADAHGIHVTTWAKKAKHPNAFKNFEYDLEASKTLRVLDALARALGKDDYVHMVGGRRRFDADIMRTAIAAIARTAEGLPEDVDAERIADASLRLYRILIDPDRPAGDLEPQALEIIAALGLKSVAAPSRGFAAKAP